MSVLMYSIHFIFELYVWQKNKEIDFIIGLFSDNKYSDFSKGHNICTTENDAFS